MEKIGIVVGNISKRAGIERAVTNLANILTRNGKEVYIFSLFSIVGASSAYEVDKSVEIINMNLNNSTRYHQTVSYIKFIKKIRKIIEEKNIKMIIGSTHAYNMIFFFLQNDIKKIGCEHFNYDSCTKASKVLRRFFYPFLDAVVLLTNADSERYKFVRKEKLKVIPNSLSFECPKPSDCSCHRMISAGRLTNQKGYDILINLLGNSKIDFEDWIIDIYGEGEDESKLLELIEKNHLKSVVRINKSTDDIMSQMCKSSIYLMTSRFEGLPMVLIEAQECGLPIISFDCKEGPADIVEDGKNGYLIPCWDEEKFIERLIEVMENDAMRKTMGHNAYSSAKRFSDENVGNRWMALIEELNSK